MSLIIRDAERDGDVDEKKILFDTLLHIVNEIEELKKTISEKN